MRPYYGELYDKKFMHFDDILHISHVCVRWICVSVGVSVREDAIQGNRQGKGKTET